MHVIPSSLQFRDHIEKALQISRLAITAELLLASLVIVLQVLGWTHAALIYLLVIALLSLWLRKIGRRELWFSCPERWKFTLLGGVIAGIAYQLISIVIVSPFLIKITGHLPVVSAFTGLRGNVTALLAALVTSWTVAAFLEEFVFRGYLLNRITGLTSQTSVGWASGLLISAAAFGSLHAYQGLPGAVDNLLFGLVLGGLFLAGRRSLWAPVIAHSVYDTTGFLLIFLGLVH